MNFAVHRFCGATETDLSGLMCSAGGRAPGNMDLWKGSVRNFCVTDCFYAGEQKLLRVAKPDLTDGSSDTAYRGFKKRFSSVFCQFQNFFCFFSGKIYNICAFIRRKTDFRISDALSLIHIWSFPARMPITGMILLPCISQTKAGRSW